MVAVERGHSEVVSLLIDSTAYVNEQDARGRTPLMLAAAGGGMPVWSIIAGTART